MFSFNLKLVFRSLYKNKSISAINILGISFSIAVCLAIGLFIIYENSYDDFHKNAENIYRLIDNEDNTSLVDNKIKENILGNIPVVEASTRATLLQRKEAIRWEGKFIETHGLLSTDNSFFEVFSVNLIEGNVNEPLPTENSVLLSASISGKLFGKVNPIGQTVHVAFVTGIVSGVFEDIPDNSSFTADVIINKKKYPLGQWCDSRGCYYPSDTFLLLQEGITVEEAESSINKTLTSSAADLRDRDISLQSLSDIYLYDTTNTGRIKKGNLQLLNILLAICIITLILALINYINLAISWQRTKAKHSGISKTMGASLPNLIYRYILESLVMISIALILSLLIAEVSLPYFNSVFQRELTIDTLFNFNIILSIIVSFIILGTIAGLFPAYYFASLNTVSVLSQTTSPPVKNSYLRNSLVVFQYVVSITLFISIIVIYSQINYVKHAKLGFDESQLLYIEVPDQQYDYPTANRFKNELLKLPDVKNVSITNGIPGAINMSSRVSHLLNDMTPVIISDKDFMQTFKLDLIHGRNFSDGDYNKSCIINESALKLLGWNSIDDSKLDYGGRSNIDVVGVTKDFHVNTLHDKIEPLFIFNMNDEGRIINRTHINIRISTADISKVIDDIQKSWYTIYPDSYMDFQFYDSWIDSMYNEEERLARAITTFALLAIIISCLGVFGLAIYSSSKRIKEIGIRKILGASIYEIILLLNLSFIKWIVAAFLIASPVALYIMNSWLQNFAYKIKIEWWMFVSAGLVTMGLALLTISWISFKAASADPVKSLKYE